MYTTQGSPIRAHTVAVATPCCPAPVSAMMRVLPSRCANRIWPTVLFILWAPVWHRSSRLKKMRVLYLADSRLASNSGVGRPT